MKDEEEKKPEQEHQGKISKADQEYLRKAEEELPDANKFVENTDALIAGVDPQQHDQEDTDKESKS